MFTDGDESALQGGQAVKNHRPEPGHRGQQRAPARLLDPRASGMPGPSGQPGPGAGSPGFNGVHGTRHPRLATPGS